MRWASCLVVRVRAKRHLIPQCHYCVDCAEQNQSERNRDVEQQPAVQPMMQALLARELARFVANVFQIVHDGVAGRREHGLEGGESAFCAGAVAQAGAAEGCEK